MGLNKFGRKENCLHFYILHDIMHRLYPEVTKEPMEGFSGDDEEYMKGLLKKAGFTTVKSFYQQVSCNFIHPEEILAWLTQGSFLMKKLWNALDDG